MRQMVREVVEPLIGELRTFMKVDHMDDMRKMIRQEMNEVVKMQLGASVGNIQLLADEVRSMQVLRSRDQLDIAQLRLQSQQALPIHMLPQFAHQTFTPNASPLGGYGMDIPSGQGVGSDTMNKRNAEQMGETDLRGLIADAAKEFLGGGQQQEGAMGQQGAVGAVGSSGQLGGLGVARSTSPMGPGLLRQGNGMQNWARQQLAASGQQAAQAETMRQLQEQQLRQQAGAMEQQTQALGMQQQVQQQHGLDLQQYQQQAAQQQQQQQMQQQQMLQQQQLMAQQQLLQSGQQGQASLPGGGFGGPAGVP